MALAARGLGNVWPNPAVGCVVVRDGRIVGRGWTQPGGRPHAESMALQQAGDQARGATAYVSLEPCAHHGQTPPCAEALIAAGIARAVIAAPEHHEVVFENDKVRVVNVLVKPGERENMHTHRWSSVFIINSFPEVNYYLEDGSSTPRTGGRREGVPHWIEPEGIHAVENIDTRPFEGVRIELKD